MMGGGISIVRAQSASHGVAVLLLIYSLPSPNADGATQKAAAAERQPVQPAKQSRISDGMDRDG